MKIFQLLNTSRTAYRDVNITKFKYDTTEIDFWRETLFTDMVIVNFDLDKFLFIERETEIELCGCERERCTIISDGSINYKYSGSSFDRKANNCIIITVCVKKK